MCADADYLEAVDGIRDMLTGVEHFIALEGSRDGWRDYEETLAAHGPDYDAVEIAETDLLTINYTSGTTARPKGVMITHRNAYMNIMGARPPSFDTGRPIPLDPADVPRQRLDLHLDQHGTGYAHMSALRRVEPPLIFKLIKDENITMFCAAPTVLISIANAPAETREGAPRGVRLFTAGAPPAAATIETVERDLGWDLTHVYGLTETAPLITFCEPRPDHQNLPLNERAKIKARQGVELISSGELRVVDDDGNAVSHDGETLGEITVRGNVVMKGYYNDPEATAAAIKNGWFHSGDAAVVHDDGFVEIRDRFKDVIISGGENISSVEVEGCLLHPSVQEVAVVGMPHEKWGESPHAFVVLKEGAAASEDEIKLHVRDNLAHFKTPSWVSFVEDLPKTATGKVQKYVLRGGASGISRQ